MTAARLKKRDFLTSWFNSEGPITSRHALFGIKRWQQSIGSIKKLKYLFLFSDHAVGALGMVWHDGIFGGKYDPVQ